MTQYSAKEGVIQVYSHMAERLEQSRAKLNTRDAVLMELNGNILIQLRGFPLL